MKNREKMVKQIALIGLIFNIILTISKISIGLIGNSSALFADGIHSLADVFASLIIYLVIGFASQPADEDHPYGHGKAEVIISGLVGIILLAVSIYIVFEAIAGFFHPIETPSLITMWVALISYIIKEILYRTSLKASKKYESKAIEAMAYDHKADILASLVAAFGVLITYLGIKLELTYLLYSDKLASILVAYLIYKLAKEMMVESFHILLERNVDEVQMNDYVEIVNGFEEVKRIDKIRAREHGHYVLVDLRISIPHDKTIKQGHDLCRDIKGSLMKKFDNIDEVLIHLNPYFEED